MEDVRDKYRNEPEFHHLVDVIRATMARAEFTTTEVKQAAVLACIMYEQMNVGPFFYVERIEEDMRRRLGVPQRVTPSQLQAQKNRG